jgi:hypothetical protein
MTIDELLEQWKLDSKVDDLNVDLEGANVSKLHSKYIQLLSDARRSLHGLLFKKKILFRNLREYYLGTASQELLAEMKRTPFLHRVLKNEVMTYIDSDDEYVELEFKIVARQERVDVLTEIMKSINSRNYSLALIKDWKRLMLGA